MTKHEKILSLADAMIRDTRGVPKMGELDGTGEKFYHFTDTAPKELVDLFLEHYEVRDIDYETFSRACDIVSDCYNDNEQEKDGLDFVVDMIYERTPDSASVWTTDRLAYLDRWNQDEISELLTKCGVADIATACAIWYDRQVEQAAVIINEWINA